MSITPPIIKPITGPKYQPIIITGNQAKDNDIPPIIFMLIRFNKILKAIKKAKTKIVFVVLKTLIGQKGNKNFINVFLVVFTNF